MQRNATNMVDVWLASETNMQRNARKNMQGGKAACEGKSTEGFCGWKRTYARRVYEWRVMPWKKFCKISSAVKTHSSHQHTWKQYFSLGKPSVYARNCSQTTREQANTISIISIKQNMVFRVFKVFWLRSLMKRGNAFINPNKH